MKDIIRIKPEDVVNAFSGMENELVVVCYIQTCCDGDDKDWQETDVKVETAKEAIDELLLKQDYLIMIGGKYCGSIKGKSGRYGYGAYGSCYMLISPVKHGTSVSARDIANSINDWVFEEWKKAHQGK